MVRETFEESGFEVRATKLIAVYDRNRHGHPPIPSYVYKLLFRCELVGGTPVEGPDIEGVGFFRENEMPQLSLSRIVPSQYKRVFEHYRHFNWPTDFD